MSLPQLHPTIPAVLPAPATSREERVHALDNLRAWAMFFGILLHAAISFMQTEFPWAMRDTRTHWSFDLMIALIHGFRMQLFFFIAGFFARLLYDRLGTREFSKHRLKRIGVPLVIGMFVLIPMTGAIWVWGNLKMGRSIEPPHNAGGLAAIPSGHLWFLQYLLILYVVSVVLASVGKRLPSRVYETLDRGFDFIIRSRFGAFLLVPLTVLCLWNGPILGEPDHMGLSIFPATRAVAYFGLFFLAGWWMHRRRHQLSDLSRYLKSGFGLAVLAILVHIAIVGSQPKSDQPNYEWLKVISLSCISLYAWIMTFAVTGWFLRFAGQHQPWMRYLADASYWCYLAHLPLVMALQVYVSQWPMNPWLKFTLINVVTMFFLLITYHWCVRYTFIGNILNGPRARPPS